MNKYIKNINNYYLKRLIKKELVYYQIVDDYIILSDKYSLAILKNDEFYLNINLMKEIELKRFIDDVEKLEYSNIESKFNDKKYTYVYKEDNKIIFKKLYDSLFDDLDIKVRSDVEPVLFYYNKELRGLVLPVKEY